MRLQPTDEQQLLQQEERSVILVVDDEAVIRDLCSRALKDYRILQAEHGLEALQILEQQPVDLMLVDVMMPAMNGLELLQRVKEHNPDQLVIVMTGFADKDIILKALKAHADDFISKPINLLQLKTSIDNALEKQALHRELSQLKRLDRLKADFLGLVSHKLRTPATSISLFIQNLASGNVDCDSPEFSSALKAISEESEYLAYLIQDLLYYSEIILQESRGNNAPEDVRELAVAVLAEKRDAAAAKGLALKNMLTGSWPTLLVDRQRIAFALAAILDNAIKFTPTGGEVILSGEVGDEQLTLTVTDNGPGVSDEEAIKVFEKFYQIDPYHTGQIRGFGLGLFYARQFVRDHGGNITLESRPGDGTTVTIVLPRQPGTTSS